MVDCLNHVAKKPLGWRTSTEVQNGDTGDISPFRFKFWQSIKFIDDAQFLESGWSVGRFLGIEFHPTGYHNTLDATWQRTMLHMVFDIKQDLTRKCRLVAGGHLVDMLDIQVYSSTVKSISVQFLIMISHKVGLEQLCGDIGNAVPNAFTKEKVYIVKVKAGIEFGDYAGKCVIVKKALYDLCSSAKRFHAHLADSFRSLEFKQTRFDNDVWFRSDESGKQYEYMCTHVDDFMICSKNANRVMKFFQGATKLLSRE